LLANGAADQAPQVTIGATTLDSTSPAKLHYLGQVYVSVYYKSTVPVEIFASLASSSDSRQCTPIISMMTGTTSIYPAGEGEALCATSPILGRATDANTIVIIVKSAETGEQLDVTHVPVDFSWDTRHLPRPEPADWVKALQHKLDPPQRP
jgi:hypothetical protein